MTFIQKNPNKREKNNIEIVKLVQKGKKKKKKTSTRNKCITFVTILPRDCLWVVKKRTVNPYDSVIYEN